jgi:hypothetical protein
MSYTDLAIRSKRRLELPINLPFGALAASLVKVATHDELDLLANMIQRRRSALDGGVPEELRGTLDSDTVTSEPPLPRDFFNLSGVTTGRLSGKVPRKAYAQNPETD